MTPALLLLVTISVLLSSGAQILLKLGMTSDRIRAVLYEKPPLLDLMLTVGCTPSVIAGLFCFGLSAIVWLFVLARIPLSSAYPFVALGIAITVLAGNLIFHEPISISKMIGVGLILIGIGTVALAS